MKNGIVALIMMAGTWFPSCSIAAHDCGYRMEILINGVSVQEYQQSECRYIEALRGKEYSIRLYNPTAGRVAVSLSVDGLNSIDARHTTAGERLPSGSSIPTRV